LDLTGEETTWTYNREVTLDLQQGGNIWTQLRGSAALDNRGSSIRHSAEEESNSGHSRGGNAVKTQWGEWNMQQRGE